MSQNSFQRVADAADIADGTHQAFDVAGVSVLVAHVKGTFYAVENECTHQKAELAGGKQKSCFLFCPLHGLRFDLRDGTSKGKLSGGDLRIFETRVVDGTVEVLV